MPQRQQNHTNLDPHRRRRVNRACCLYEEEDKLEEHDGGRALSLCQHRLSTAFVGTKAEVTSDPWKGGMATNGVDSLTVPQALRRLSSRSTCHTASIRYM